MLASVRPRQLRLLVTAHGADHGGAEGARPLAHDEAHATGGRVDEDGVALLDLADAQEQIVGGHALQHHGRGGPVVDPLRQRHQAVRGDESRLRVGAEGRGAVSHAHSGLEVADAGPHRLDQAGRFRAGSERVRRRLVEPGAIVDVDVIEANRRVADAGLARARLADGHVLPAQDLRTTGLVHPNRFHGLAPSCSESHCISFVL